MITCLVLAAAILIIKFRKKYNWLIFMLCLLIIADIGIISTNFGYVIQHNATYTEDHILSLKIMIGFGNFTYNFFLNVVHWLFGFEYWYISVEVPRLQKEKPRTITKRQFSIIKYVGVALNFIPCLMMGYYQWILQEAILNQYRFGTPLPDLLINTILVLEYIIVLLIVISTCFLAVAL